jgi:hypothetical protein
LAAYLQRALDSQPAGRVTCDFAVELDMRKLVDLQDFLTDGRGDHVSVVEAESSAIQPPSGHDAIHPERIGGTGAAHASPLHSHLMSPKRKP